MNDMDGHSSIHLLGTWLAAAIILAPTSAKAQIPDQWTVRESEVIERKIVFGTVESVDLTAARARIGGTLATVEIDEGSTVTADEIVARVEDPKLALRLKATAARIAALKSQRDLAVIALNRTRTLRKQGAASQARLDEASTALDVIERDLTAMHAEYAVIAEQRQEGEVKAPRSGRVLDVAVTPGQVVLPGERIATIAAEAYVLRLSLPERHAGSIRAGDKVSVGARSLLTGGTEMTAPRDGTIRQVYPKLDRGRVVADVTVDGLGDFFVGERVPVHIAAGRRYTIVVPAPYLANRYGVTFVRHRDGRENVVQTGERTADGIEVLSGLRIGDILIPAVGAAGVAQ